MNFFPNYLMDKVYETCVIYIYMNSDVTNFFK